MRHFIKERLSGRQMLWDVVVAMIAVALGYVVWLWFQVPGKSLALGIASNIPVLSLKDNRLSDLTLLYKNKEIETYSVVEISIANTGDAQISPEDYSKPLEFSFNGDIASAPSIISSHRAQLTPKFVLKSKRTAVLEPLLLQKDEGFNVLFNIVNYKSSNAVVIADGRIAGVKKINLDNTPPVKSASYKGLAVAEAVLLGVLVFVAGVFVWRKRNA